MLVAHAYPEHIVIVIIIFIVMIISLVLSYVEVMVSLQLIIIFSLQTNLRNYIIFKR